MSTLYITATATPSPHDPGQQQHYKHPGTRARVPMHTPSIHDQCMQLLDLKSGNQIR